MWAGAAAAGLALAALTLGGSVPAPKGAPAGSLRDIRLLEPPTRQFSQEPFVTTTADGRIRLMWFERTLDGKVSLRTASLADGRWQASTSLEHKEKFTRNWADSPELVRLGGKRLALSWLAEIAATEFSYGVRVQQSRDDGASWGPVAIPYRDSTIFTKGFASMAPEGDGVRVVWLDARASANAPEGEVGDTQLRTAHVAGDGTVSGEQVLLPRVCDCCRTAIVAVPSGFLVAYRGRSPDEVRDISLLRYANGTWGDPQLLHADGWTIRGCPVNPPAMDAAGSRVVIAWFTEGGGRSRLSLAFSNDGGATFGDPIVVDRAGPIGRVRPLLLPDGSALVVWMGNHGRQSDVRVARVSARGEVSPVSVVGITAPGRVSGFPSIARSGDHVVVAWTDVGVSRNPRIVLAEAQLASPAGPSAPRR